MARGVTIDRPAKRQTGLEEPLSRAAERILQVARECFDRDGFEKPTIEDIATMAGVSRQTVYNHFSSKRDIIDRLTIREMVGLQEDIRSRLKKYPQLGDRITEAIIISVSVAQENPFMRRILYDVEASPEAQPGGVVHQWHRAQWRPALEAGIRSGELKPDLDLDEAISWLGFCQFVLLIKVDQSGLDVGQLRKFVRSFMVDALLHRPGEGGGERPAADARAEQDLALYKEMVLEQAVKIRQLEKALAAAREANG